MSSKKVMENIPLNFPLLSSLPFFSATAVAFVCQIIVMCLAWFVGRTQFSLWWIFLGALMWWLAIRSKEKAQNMRRAYDGLQNNDQKFIRDRVEELPSWVYFPDQERAEWFNRMMHQLWPFMNLYLQNLIISIMEPAVNNALPKIMKFEFERITMGDEAPRVGGMKVYKEHIARGEIVMDAQILYAGDCEVKARVGKFRIGFNQITLQGTMRIIFKPLVREMPFVGGITAFFLSTPAVDFNLTDLADVMDIPGLSELMRKVVQEQINYFTVLPNKITIPLIQNLSKYDLKFIPPDGVLRVFIAEAQELERADVGLIGKGKSDPYCVVKVGAQIFQTQVIKENINPNWSEYFEFIVDQASGQSLEIEVFDKDKGNNDDFLGRLTMDVFPIVKEGTVDKWFRLEDCETGNIRVRLYWLGLSSEANLINSVIRETTMLSDRTHLSSCMLMVFIDCATALPNVKKIASEPHPYCVATVGKQSYTTVVAKRTYDPVWESQTSFLISDPKSDVIKFEVMDSKSSKKLGWIEVPLRSLLEKNNMDASGLFALKNSGPHSELRLNLRLRLLKAISLPEAMATAQKMDLNPSLTANADATGRMPKERTPPEGTPISAQEFKEGAGSGDDHFDGGSVGNVRVPVDLEAESELRQRNSTSAAARLTMRWGESRRALFVAVHEVRNISKLVRNHNVGNAHYVSVTCNVGQTKTKRRTKEFIGDPDQQSYEETLDFPIDDEQLLKTAYLELKVKAKSGPFAKDAVVQTIVSLENVIGVSSHTDWYTLEEADAK
ncbi:extended synaptotagmin-2-like [Paramacrobiotus metropolitanus]|uniref:extended synaptotagmin-2-like n=1 Tax=Paramacrobiotus metropolitanus TaxID=2943436 RepID=UPI0024460B67|nr:extended synaptotagmin-2-like [Paramacrobiotus metropolitanus]